MSPDDLVDNCLTVLGQLDVLDSTRSGLKKYASKYGHLSWEENHNADQFDKAAVAVIQLVVSSQEYQIV